MLNSNGFVTDSRMLENTIKLFMTDVVNMQHAQLAREQEIDKQRSETRGKGPKKERNLDVTIAKAVGLSSKNSMKEYE